MLQKDFMKARRPSKNPFKALKRNVKIKTLPFFFLVQDWDNKG